MLSLYAPYLGVSSVLLYLNRSTKTYVYIIMNPTKVASLMQIFAAARFRSSDLRRIKENPCDKTHTGTLAFCRADF